MVSNPGIFCFANSVRQLLSMPMTRFAPFLNAHTHAIRPIGPRPKSRRCHLQRHQCHTHCDKMWEARPTDIVLLFLASSTRKKNWVTCLSRKECYPAASKGSGHQMAPSHIRPDHLHILRQNANSQRYQLFSRHKETSGERMSLSYHKPW